MEASVEKYLQNNLSEFSLSQDDILDYHIYRQYQSKQTGLTHVFLQQNYQGIPIHKAEIRLHWREDKAWLKTQNTFVKDLNNREIQSQATIGEVRAIEYACSALGINYSKPNRISKKVESTSLFEADFSTY